MRRWWLVLITLAAGTAGAATVWRWVDADGVTHYSDRPVAGAEQIELTSVQTFPAQRAGQSAARSPGPSAAGSPTQRAVTRYTRLEIVQPGQQETLWNIGGTLQIEVAVEPPLEPDHRVDVYLDGVRQRIDATSTQLTVPEVHRGAHTIQAAVFDANGNEAARSLAVTFFVQQTSIQNPANRAPPARGN